jgi:PAS domain S-box-containing protein
VSQPIGKVIDFLLRRSPNPSKRAQQGYELVVAAIGIPSLFILATIFDLPERLIHKIPITEQWELDKIVFLAWLATVFLAWLAYRHWGDLKPEIVEYERLEKALYEPKANYSKHPHEPLEQQVEQRTVELSKANRLLVQEIVERKRVEEILQHQLKAEQLIAMLSTQFINLRSLEIDGAINHALQLIGEFAGVDRSYVFLISEDSQAVNNTHEWCRAGIEPQIDKLHGVSIDSTPWWTEKLNRFETIHIPRVADLPAEARVEKTLLERQSIQSLVVMPMIYRGRLSGFLGFDSVRMEKSWPEQDIILLKMVGEIFVNALERRWIEEAIRQAEQRYHDLFEEAPVMYVITRSHEGMPLITNCNQLFLTTLGYSRSEVLGQPLADFYTSASRRRLLVEGGYSRALAGEFKAEERGLLTRDGRIIETLLRAVPERQANSHLSGTRAMFIDITERKQAEETLDLSEERFAKAFRASPDGIVITRVSDGQIIEVNDRWCTLFGHSRAEAMGRTTVELSLYAQPEGRQLFLNQLETQGFVRDLELELRRKSGEVRQISVSSEILVIAGETCVLSHTQDITQRKQMEERLVQERNLLRTLIDNLPDSIYVKDTAGRHLLVNRAIVQGTGFTLEEILGKTDLELYPAEVAEGWYADDLAVIQSGQPLINQEELLFDKNVCVGWDLTTKVPFYDSHGQMIGLVGVTRDITERKRAEKALFEERALLAQHVAERTADLSRANAELARANRLKDEFLANMSHELRTPLNVILGMSEVLRSDIYGSLNQKQLEALACTEESGHHLLALINDILDLSKIEADKLGLDITNTSVEEVCQASLRLIKQIAQEKSLKISTTLDSTVTTLPADERRLKQILVNLLTNAVKFTPAGNQIGLEVASDEILNMVRFTVWDTGIGISAEDTKCLFQPFVQLDSKLSRQYEGTGLGLALVSRLAEMHGGRVSVESKVGQGSRFTVSLPRFIKTGLTKAPEEAEFPQPQGLISLQEREESLVIAPSAAQKGEKPLILLGEDNEASLAIVSDFLEAKGCQVMAARNGLEALERAQEQLPAVILMDIQMPVMDGLEAIVRLRSDNKAGLAILPIIALTALAMPGDEERCMKAGATAYLRKPVGLVQLWDLVEPLIVQQSRTGE